MAITLTYTGAGTGATPHALHTLGVLQIQGQSVERERLGERHTLRLRLEFFARTYRENLTQVDLLRTALKSTVGTLVLTDENGVTRVNRLVHAAPDAEPADGRGPLAGTTMQAVTFEFWWWEVDVAGEGLVCTVAGPSLELALGQVEEFKEGYTAEFYQATAAARRRLGGTVEARGWFSPRVAGAESQALATRRASLQAQRDGLLLVLAEGGETTLTYGTFNRPVRVSRCDVQINQAQDRIEWSFTGSFNRWPADATGVVCDYTVTRRQAPDGAQTGRLAGRITAPTAADARAAVAALRATHFPGTAGAGEATWVLVHTEDTERLGQSGPTTELDQEATTTAELDFADDWKRRNDLRVTFRRVPATGSPPDWQDLGTVEGWAERYATGALEEMRAPRRRTGGALEIRGRWEPDSFADTPAVRRAALLDRRSAWMTEMTARPELELRYGPPGSEGQVFSGRVRVRTFDAVVHEGSWTLEWTLAVEYTVWPNEANYLLLEYQLDEAEDREGGTVTRQFTGRIGAATEAQARAKLTALEGTLCPNTDWVCATRSANVRTVASESGEGAYPAVATVSDGSVFTELSFSVTFRKFTASVVSATCRITPGDDLKAGFVTTTYAGEVTAQGVSEAAAISAAQAKATALGDAQLPFRLNGQQTVTNVQRLATGSFLSTVQFSYAYQAKPGSGTYLEWTVEISTDAAGAKVETVSGYATGSTLVAAEARVTALRNTYAGRLFLSDRSATSKQERVAAATTVLEDRVAFQWTLHVARTQVSAAYTVAIENDYATLERRVTLAGTILGATAADCRLVLPVLRAAAGLTSSPVQTRESTRQQTSERAVPANPGTVPNWTPYPSWGQGTFLAFEFSETHSVPLTGFTQIVSCEVVEETQAGGIRYVEKPLPDGPSVIQNAGWAMGTVTVTGQVSALSRDTCTAWATKCQTALLPAAADTYDHPAQLGWTMGFAPLTDGTPLGAGLNVRLHTLRFSYRRWRPRDGWVEPA
jgi:hypothetical protein